MKFPYVKLLYGGFAVLAVLALLFTLSLFNYKSSFFIQSDGFSERLIIQSLERYVAVGDTDVGGFMIAFEEAVHIAAVQAILGPEVERKVYPYISNFNGQYAAATALVDLFGLKAAQAYYAMRALAALSMIGTLALVAMVVRRDFGATVAVVVLLPFVLSGLFLFRSMSAYWMLFLNFLPMAVVMTLYPYARAKRHFFLLLVLVLLIVFVKSLVGYEYLSCVTLSAMAPLLYYELGGTEYKAAKRSIIVSRLLALGAVCVIGFLLAIGLHVIKLAAYFGSLADGLASIKMIASYTALQDESGIRGGAPTLTEALIAWLKTFLIYNAHITVMFFVVAVWIALSAAVAPQHGTLRTSLRRYFSSPLFYTTLFSIAATLSWSFVMVKHGVVHPHINWVQNYMCAYVYLVISLVHLAKTVSQSSPQGTSVRA